MAAETASSRKEQEAKLLPTSTVESPIYRPARSVALVEPTTKGDGNCQVAPPPVRTRSDRRKQSVVGFEPRDGGWGWVVCLASFWTNGTIFGILNTFGILYVQILEDFDDGLEGMSFRTSWIGSLQIAMTFFLSPIASILVDRLGIRPVAFTGAVIATSGMLASSFVPKLSYLYFTYGILLGVGSSLVYTASMAILPHYFKQHLGIVNGFVTFGSAVFTFVLPFVERILLENVGLRNTMRVLASFLAVLMVCALVWQPQFSPKESAKESARESGRTGINKQIHLVFNLDNWKNKGYIIWVIALPVAFLGYFVPFVHLPKHVEDTMPNSNTAVLMMCLGITSGISRLIAGKVADVPGINRILMQQLAFLVLGATTSCIPFAKHYTVLIVIVLIMGISDGCFICLLGPIANDLLGPAGQAQGLGCLLGLMSMPMTAGPPLAGLMYDKMQTYRIAFHLAGLPPIVGALILFLMPEKKTVLTVEEYDMPRVPTEVNIAQMGDFAQNKEDDAVGQPEEPAFDEHDEETVKFSVECNHQEQETLLKNTNVVIEAEINGKMGDQDVGCALKEDSGLSLDDHSSAQSSNVST